MINAQEWLDKNYLKEERKKITELDINRKKLEGELKLEGFINLQEIICSWNELTKLDLSDCQQLTYLNCAVNLLTNIKFLTILPNPKKMVHLDLGDNNFSPQDLSFLEPFTNLRMLGLWTCEQERIDKGIYNRFFGSLKFLRNMKDLIHSGIANTDIEEGLEYLVNTKISVIPFDRTYWSPIGIRSGAKVNRIQMQLAPFDYDFRGWWKLFQPFHNRLLELQKEKIESGKELPQSSSEVLQIQTIVDSQVQAVVIEQQQKINQLEQQLFQKEQELISYQIRTNQRELVRLIAEINNSKLDSGELVRKMLRLTKKEVESSKNSSRYREETTEVIQRLKSLSNSQLVDNLCQVWKELVELKIKLVNFQVQSIGKIGKDWFSPAHWLTSQEIDWSLNQLWNDLVCQKLDKHENNSLSQLSLISATSFQKDDYFLELMLDLMLKEDEQLIFIPINNNDNNHWSLLTYEFKKKIFYHLDSTQEKINGYIAREVVRKLRDEQQISITANFQELTCTQQTNSDDCGMALISFTQRIMENYQSSGSLSEINFSNLDFINERIYWRERLEREQEKIIEGIGNLSLKEIKEQEKEYEEKIEVVSLQSK